MKVAIDTGPLTSGDKVRGVGFYTRHLIDALKKKSQSDKDFDIHTLDSEEIKDKSSEFDIIHIPYFYPFFETVPVKLKSKIIITVHDVIPLLYPDKYPAGIRGKYRFYKQKRRLSKVDAVITDSESSKKDIVRILGVAQEKVFPIYLAPKYRRVTDHKRLKSIKQKYNLPDKFILYVGDLNYNKNIPILVKASQAVGVPLVIVGKAGKDIENYKSDLHNLDGPRDWLRFLFGKPHPEISHYGYLLNLFEESDLVNRLGFVPDKDMPSIYSLANVYVQPSFAEGFGLPPLEAMSCGTPVIVSKSQCLVEIMNGRALIAMPESTKDFAKKISAVLNDRKLSDKLTREGVSYTKEFSWELTAKKTIDVYKKVAY